MANLAGRSKVTASTSQAAPREPPFRKAQLVSFEDVLRLRSNQRQCTGSHQNSVVKRAWPRVVLGWVTSWEVLLLYPLFAFCINLDLPSLAERSPPFLVIFFFRGKLGVTVHYGGPAASDIRAQGVGTMGLGRPGPKTVGLALRMDQFDPASVAKRACLFAL